jgi:predicted DNA-binding protein YlxM (UPF0122 family)
MKQIQNSIPTIRTTWEIVDIPAISYGPWFKSKPYPAIVGPHQETGGVSIVNGETFKNYCHVEIHIQEIKEEFFVSHCTVINDHMRSEAHLYSYRPGFKLFYLSNDDSILVHRLIKDLLLSKFTDED